MNEFKRNKKTGSSVAIQRRARSPWFTIFIIILSLIFGVGGGILGSRFLIPYLATLPFVSEDLLIPSEGGEVIIQRNEVVEVRETQDLSDAIQKVSPALVSVFSEEDKKGVSGEIFTISGGVSGFVVTSDGLILTDKQFVADAQRDYFVRVNSGEVYPVQAVIQDPLLDIALLRIEANNLPVVEFGVSDEVMLGDRVVLMGNQAILSSSQLFVETISSLHFSAFTDGEKKIHEMFSLSNKFAYSLSGSPVVSLDGRVLGVYSKKRQGSLEYVVPIDYVKDVVGSSLSDGEIRRVTLPFEYVELSNEFAQMNGIDRNAGALVTQIIDDSFNFELGDIVIAVDDTEVAAQISFTELVMKLVDAEEVVLTILRENEEKKVIISQ